MKYTLYSTPRLGDMADDIASLLENFWANGNSYLTFVTQKNLLIRPAQRHAKVLIQKIWNQAESIAVLIPESPLVRLS